MRKIKSKSNKNGIKKIILVLIILMLFCIGSVYAEEAGWAPKWNVGDWWVVRFEYYYSITPSRKANWIEIRFKFIIESEENIDGEQVFKLNIIPLDYLDNGPEARTLYISKQTFKLKRMEYYEYEVKKFKYNYQGKRKLLEDYIIDDKKSTGNFWGIGHFNLHAMPILPITFGEKEYTIFFKEKDISVGEKYFNFERFNKQKVIIIDENSMLTNDKINKEYLNGNIYKVILANGDVIEYWSENAPWYIYFEEGKRTIGYLEEWHKN